jgi:hypothetical protein
VSPDRRKLETGRRIEGNFAAGQRAPEDRADREERVPDRRGVEAVGQQPIDERLQIRSSDVAQAGAAELGQHPEPQRLLVATDDAGLVDVTGPIAHGTLTRALEPGGRRLGQHSGRSRRHSAPAQRHLGLAAPGFRLGERRERLAEIPRLARAIDLRAVRRRARACSTNLGRALARVAHLDPGMPLVRT